MQLIFLTLVLIGFGFVACDPPVTPLDRAALKKFRPMVVDFLPHEYMKTDAYLLRWIRTKKYDLEGAEELLRKNIEWRKENNLDNFKYNKNGPFHKDFPIDVEGVDNEGHPGLPVFLDYATVEESYYPLGGKEFMGINAPRAVETVVRLIAPIVGDTINRIRVFGSDKRVWRSYLLDRIPVDQLTPQFGGKSRGHKTGCALINECP